MRGNNNEPLGETFDGDDEFTVRDYKGCVVVEFNKPVNWFALEPDLARQLASALLTVAEKINPRLPKEKPS